MLATVSKKDFLMFRNTLTELERLVEVRGNLLHGGHGSTTIAEGILHVLELLTECDVNCSESTAIEELEHLVTMKVKSAEYSRQHWNKDVIHDGRNFDQIIDTKIDFIKKYSYSRYISDSDVEPMTALERLAEVQKKLRSKKLHELLESKIREIVWRPKAKASLRLVSNGRFH